MSLDLFKGNKISDIQLSYKEIKKLDNKLSVCKKACECGHVLMFTSGIDKIYCNWCGKYCYKDKQTEFKYKMQSKLAK